MVSTASHCPACGAARAGQAPICDSCGLVFASQPSIPPAARARAAGFTRLQPGQPLAGGRYTIQRALSKGGMGAIYLATDHGAFDRTVVVKAMLDYFNRADPQAARAARERFVQEARTLAALSHPAIPQIFAYFQEGPNNYIVMQYIEGHDLLQRLTHQDDASGRRVVGRAYPPERVLSWGVALCRALEYLAAQRPNAVVHHDIKPANLLLDHNSGEIRLVDFGTARARLHAQAVGIGLRQSSIYGTQGYAAPEQYSGQSEPRSDVYALAATLYHLATDDDPRNHPFDFPRLKELGALGRVLEQALDTSVHKRPSAAELRRRLENQIAPSAGRPLQAPDGQELYDAVELARWCETNWQPACGWLYGALPGQLEQVWGRTRLAREIRDAIRQHWADRSAGLDVALALLDPQGFGAAQPQVIAATEALDFGALAPGVACEQLLILANGGRRHVNASLALPNWISASQARISLPPGQRTTIELSAAGEQAPAIGQLHDHVVVRNGATALLEVETWAAVSRWSALRRRARPWLLPAIAAVSLALLLLRAAWPAPQPVSYTRYSPMIEAPATALPATIAPAPTAGAAAQPANVVHTPQGDTYVLAAPPQLQGALFQELKTLTERRGQFQSAAFSPDGRALAVGAADGAIQLWSVEDNALLWSAGAAGDAARALAFSPDGKTLAASGPGGAITLRQAGDGKLLQTLDGHGAAVVGLAFSPDGQTLASAAGKTVALWPASGGEQVWQAEGDAQVHDVAFSPDGQALASAGEDGAIKLWQAADGELDRTLTQRRGALARVAFSPDGKTLAAGSADGAIELLRVADGTAFRSIDVRGGPVWSVAFSPDGAYLAAAGEDASVRVLRAGDGALLQTLDTHGRPMRGVCFGPDGKTLAAAGDGSTAMFWRASR